MVKVLYFARLKEALGVSQEEFVIGPEANTVAGIRAVIFARGGVWAEQFGADKRLMSAVNQALSDANAMVRDGDEIAFFPPMTGG